jgi:hypothetical protein
VTNPIPEDIKQRIWQLYLRSVKPLSLGKIGKMVGFSKTAVSTLINETKLQDPNYALMGALVVNLAKNGFDVFQYASCVRILNLIHEYQLGSYSNIEAKAMVTSSIFENYWIKSVGAKISN